MPSYLIRVLIAFGLAVPGIILLPIALPRPDILPDEIPKIVMAANPALFALIAAGLGAWAAPATGLRSLLITGRGDGVGGWRACWPWLIAGMCAGGVVAGLDHLTMPIWSNGITPPLAQGFDPRQFALAVTYGGVSEEIIMRWGIMSLALWGLVKLLPRLAAIWIAAGLAAALFALAHLPALFAFGPEPSTAMIARVIVFNIALGLLFGIAFARQHIEAAMSAHIGAHIGFALLGAVIVAG